MVFEWPVSIIEVPGNCACGGTDCCTALFRFNWSLLLLLLLLLLATFVVGISSSSSSSSLSSKLEFKPRNDQYFQIFESHYLVEMLVVLVWYLMQLLKVSSSASSLEEGQ